MILPSPTPVLDVRQMMAGVRTADATTRQSPPDAIGGAATAHAGLIAAGGRRRALRVEEPPRDANRRSVPEGRRRHA